MITDWATQYQRELMDIWEKQEFRKLPPLN